MRLWISSLLEVHDREEELLVVLVDASTPADDLFELSHRVDVAQQHAFDFEELGFVLIAEFFGSRLTEVTVELLPAFQVVFDLGDQSREFFVHRFPVSWLRWS